MKRLFPRDRDIGGEFLVAVCSEVMYSGQVKVHGIEISCSNTLGIFNTLCGLALFHMMQ